MQRRFFTLSLLAGGGFLTTACGGGGGGGGDGGGSPAPAPAPVPGGGEDPVTGAFVYVARPDSRDVAVHQVLASGALRLVGAAPANNIGTRAVTIHPSGRFAYAINGGDVSIYDRDTTAGTLSFRRSLPIPPFSTLTHFRFHPAHDKAFLGTEATIQAVAVDADTGDLRLGGFTDDIRAFKSFDIHPSGGYVFTVSNLMSVSWWRVVGDVMEQISFRDSAAIGVPAEVVVSPSGRFVYVTSHTSGTSVLPFDVTSEELSAPVQTEQSSVIGPIVIHPSEKFLYAAGFETVGDADLDGIHVFEIDQNAGTLTRRSFQATGSPVASLSIASGRSLYAAHGESGTVSGFAVVEATGALVSLGAPVDVGGRANGVTLFEPSA